MPISRKVLVVVALASLVLAAFALTSGGSIPRQLVSNGGGQVEGSGLALRSAIGQPAAGGVENGVRLCSGFQCGPGSVAVGAGDRLFLPVLMREAP